MQVTRAPVLDSGGVQRRLVIVTSMASPDATSPIASLHADGLQDVTAPLDDAVMLDQAPPAYRAGDLVARRYRIDRLLARGGMADVYAATDLGLRRPVALKIASGDSTAASVASERLLREAKTLDGLRHPNLVALLDQGRTLRGAAFITLERMSGMTLREYLAQNQPVPWQTAATIGLQIAAGLAAAHARGVVHCDVSPSNVLVARSEQGALTCKLIDFGLACRTGKMRSTPLHGTRRYLAPEGFSGGVADVRLDLYALGAILAEMLGPVTESSPPVLTALTTTLRASDPHSRPASASAVLEVLRQAVASEEPAPAATLRAPLPVRPPSRLAWSLVGTAVLVSAGALISAVGISRARSSGVIAGDRPPPPPVRAALQEIPARVELAVPDIALPAEARQSPAARPRPAAPIRVALRAEPRRELEAALLERRKQLSAMGIGGPDVVAVASISFDPRQRSARVAYRRERSQDELVEYWALRDGRWQPLND